MDKKELYCFCFAAEKDCQAKGFDVQSVGICHERGRSLSAGVRHVNNCITELKEER